MDIDWVVFPELIKFLSNKTIFNIILLNYFVQNFVNVLFNFINLNSLSMFMLEYTGYEIQRKIAENFN